MDWKEIRMSPRQIQIHDSVQNDYPNRSASTRTRDWWCAIMWTLIEQKRYAEVVHSMLTDAPTLGRSAKWNNACGWARREWDNAHTGYRTTVDYKSWYTVQAMVWFSQST